MRLTVDIATIAKEDHSNYVKINKGHQMEVLLNMFP